MLTVLIVGGSIHLDFSNLEKYSFVCVLCVGGFLCICGSHLLWGEPTR